jgi:hypothetical protein
LLLQPRQVVAPAFVAAREPFDADADRVIVE